MIHIVRVWMDNESNFIIGDDQEAVATKIQDWVARGGRVLSHKMIDEPSMGMVINRRKEDRPDPPDSEFDDCVWDSNRIDATKTILFHEFLAEGRSNPQWLLEKGIALY